MLRRVWLWFRLFGMAWRLGVKVRPWFGYRSFYIAGTNTVWLNSLSVDIFAHELSHAAGINTLSPAWHDALSYSQEADPDDNVVEYYLPERFIEEAVAWAVACELIDGELMDIRYVARALAEYSEAIDWDHPESFVDLDQIEQIIDNEVARRIAILRKTK